MFLHLFLYQQISIFCNFLELYSTLSEKDFCCKCSFLNGFTQTPPNSQNLLSVTKLFSQFSLKCLLKYFFQTFFDKILQKLLFCISSELLLNICFKGSIYRFSGVLFFNCYLAAPQQTLDHPQGDNPTNSILITAF